MPTIHGEPIKLPVFFCMDIPKYGMYLYTLSAPYSFNCDHLDGIAFENKWINISYGEITIAKNYSWDGCSPKFKIGNKIYGTPEGDIDIFTGLPRTYFASLIHDALYQFIDDIAKKNNISVSKIRKKADLTFYANMKNHWFKRAKIYFYAVRLFGWIFV